MKVERFFHIRPYEGSKKKFNGATVLVSGNTDHVGQVDVQVAFCSKKDMYCKRTGRSTVSKQDKIKVVPLRYLPSELGRIEEQVYGYALDNASDFLYSLRYFLPKE